jgi:hypothetical protein
VVTTAHAAMVTAMVTAVMTAGRGRAGVRRRGIGVLLRRREDTDSEQQRKDERDCKFLHKLFRFSFRGIVGQPYFYFIEGPPLPYARQCL